MKTALGNIIRQFADMVDDGTCGVSAEEFARVAEEHRKVKEILDKDHARVNILCDAMDLVIKSVAKDSERKREKARESERKQEKREEDNQPKSKAIIIPLFPDGKPKPKH